MNANMQISPFKVDVTPRIGDPICGGLMEPCTSIETSLWLRGIVLHANRTRHVVAAIDYCYLIGLSQRRLEEALARGAGVDRSQVCVQSNHTHAGPLIAEEPHVLVKRLFPDIDLHPEDYFQQVLKSAEESVKQACESPTEVGGVGFAEHAVEQFASTRRVLDENDHASIRWSVTVDQKIRNAPVGYIDPILTQIVFYDTSKKPITCLNYYACHPQVGTIDGVVHGDSIAVALKLFEQTHPDIMPIYFDGCGGDVTAGKYTDVNASRRNLHVFGVRLFDAMHEAILKARPAPIESVTWHDDGFDCPMAQNQFTEDELLEMINKPDTIDNRKFLYSWNLLRLREYPESYPFRSTLLRLNDIGILMLPAELSVEYQLWAKAQYSGRLAVAAYGDCMLNYVATDIAFDQGGYEVQPIWTEVEKGIEQHIKNHLRPILTG